MSCLLSRVSLSGREHSVREISQVSLPLLRFTWVCQSPTVPLDYSLHHGGVILARTGLSPVELLLGCFLGAKSSLSFSATRAANLFDSWMLYFDPFGWSEFCVLAFLEGGWLSGFGLPALACTCFSCFWWPVFSFVGKPFWTSVWVPALDICDPAAASVPQCWTSLRSQWPQMSGSVLLDRRTAENKEPGIGWEGLNFTIFLASG